MYFQQGASEQETLPLSAVAFRRYLEKYQIEPLVYPIPLLCSCAKNTTTQILDKREKQHYRGGQDGSNGARAGQHSLAADCLG